MLTLKIYTFSFLPLCTSKAKRNFRGKHTSTDGSEKPQRLLSEDASGEETQLVTAMSVASMCDAVEQNDATNSFDPESLSEKLTEEQIRDDAEAESLTSIAQSSAVGDRQQDETEIENVEMELKTSTVEDHPHCDALEAEEESVASESVDSAEENADDHHLRYAYFLNAEHDFACSTLTWNADDEDYLEGKTRKYLDLDSCCSKDLEDVLSPSSKCEVVKGRDPEDPKHTHSEQYFFVSATPSTDESSQMKALMNSSCLKGPNDPISARVEENVEDVEIVKPLRPSTDYKSRVAPVETGCSCVIL